MEEKVEVTRLGLCQKLWILLNSIDDHEVATLPEGSCHELVTILVAVWPKLLRFQKMGGGWVRILIRRLPDYSSHLCPPKTFSI